MLVARIAAAADISISRLKRPLANESRLKTLRVGFRHSRATTTWINDMVRNPIVIAVGRPYRGSPQEVTINVATAIIVPANANRIATLREITGSSMGRGRRFIRPGVGASK